MKNQHNFLGKITFRRAAVGLVLVLVLLALPLAVFADNVQNDVVAGGNDTITAGGSTNINYRITANSGDGQSGCNAADSSPATITINVPSGVTAVPGSLLFTSCGTNQSVNFSSITPGSYEITVSVSDAGVGTYNTNPAKFTLHVLPPADSTPPVITPSVSGTMGNNGWYTSDVTVSWSVVDNESAISSSSGCGPTTINNDTAGTTLTCTATSAGGTSSESVTIKRDATAPSISGDFAPAANGNGWNNSDVTVSFDCSDATSGVASCGPDKTLSGEGANQMVTGTAVDNAGNSASTTVGPINIDKTAPTVTVDGVTEGAKYLLGSVPAAGCNTSDGLSGVATAASLSGGYTGGVGAFTATCSGAMDNAGNGAGPVSVNFSVIYNWNGFFQPVDNNALNVAKAGSAIPVKFSLNGYQGMNIFAAGYPKSVVISCQTQQATDVIEETVTAGQSSLNYDATTDQYNYVWKTDKAWASTCRQLQVMLNDGTLHTANFQFKK